MGGIRRCVLPDGPSGSLKADYPATTRGPSMQIPVTLLRTPIELRPTCDWKGAKYRRCRTDLRYSDAERDCSAALSLQDGHLKALYRRAIARKALEQYTAAVEGDMTISIAYPRLTSDLKSVLRVEKNELATSELEEIEQLFMARQEKVSPPSVSELIEAESDWTGHI